MTPAYQDDYVTLYHGDCRKILPELDLQADLIMADPPYGQTYLAWDRLVDGWPEVALQAAKPTAGLWLWGSLDSLVEAWPGMQRAGWKRPRGVEIVWRKSRSRHALARSSRPNIGLDRFNPVHELATFWCVGPWLSVRHLPPRRKVGDPGRGRKAGSGESIGAFLNIYEDREYVDDGYRYMESVLDIPVPPLYSRVHPTEKPVALCRHMIEFGCPEGGLVVVPFAGSGSDCIAARSSGRHVVACEDDDDQIAKTVDNLRQQELF